MTKSHNIEFRYNFFIDICNSFQVWKELDWLKKNNLTYGVPSIKRTLQLLFKRPVGIDIQTKKSIICYWVSSGTWGSYKAPNTIYICPWYIENAGGLERVVRHELLHLEYYTETEKMEHAVKESFIEKKE